MKLTPINVPPLYLCAPLRTKVPLEGSLRRLLWPTWVSMDNHLHVLLVSLRPARRRPPRPLSRAAKEKLNGLGNAPLLEDCWWWHKNLDPPSDPLWRFERMEALLRYPWNIFQ
jgi:hypothetical protein